MRACAVAVWMLALTLAIGDARLIREARDIESFDYLVVVWNNGPLAGTSSTTSSTEPTTVSSTDASSVSSTDASSVPPTEPTSDSSTDASSVSSTDGSSVSSTDGSSVSSTDGSSVSSTDGSSVPPTEPTSVSSTDASSVSSTDGSSVSSTDGSSVSSTEPSSVSSTEPSSVSSTEPSSVSSTVASTDSTPASSTTSPTIPTEAPPTHKRFNFDDFRQRKVAVALATRDDEPFLAVCTGTILAERYVLTTASCALLLSKGSVSLRGTPETKIAVESVIKYSGYSTITHVNNMALLKIKEALYTLEAPMSVPAVADAIVAASDNCLTASWDVETPLLNEPVSDDRRLVACRTPRYGYACAENKVDDATPLSAASREGAVLVCDGRVTGVYSQKLHDDLTVDELMEFQDAAVFSRWINTVISSAVGLQMSLTLLLALAAFLVLM